MYILIFTCESQLLHEHETQKKPKINHIDKNARYIIENVLYEAESTAPINSHSSVIPS